VGSPINYDQLDKGKTYTITFSNPKIHALANEYRAYCWNDDLVLGEPLVGVPKYGYVEREGTNVNVYLLEEFSDMTQEAYDNRNELGGFGAHVWSLACRNATILPHMNSVFTDKLNHIRSKLPEMRGLACGSEFVGRILIPHCFRKRLTQTKFNELASKETYARFIARLADYEQP
jgi:hypothetical protein